MSFTDRLASDVGDEINELVDRHHFLRPDIDWLSEIRPRQADGALDALVHIEKRAGLQAITPYFDLAAAGCLCNLAAYRSRSLLFPARP
jgi:hypothetical protein